MSALYAVLGHPIAHSLSPALHRGAFRARGVDATYEAIDVTGPAYVRAIQELVARGVAGANLTAPLKGLGLLHADEASDEANASGAVNTLRFEGARSFGHNTDGVGFVRFLERSGLPAAGRAITFLGGGGAVAGLTHALRAAGARTLGAVVRDQIKAAAFPGLARGSGVTLLRWDSREAQRAIENADVVVQATPLGAAKHDALPCPAEWVGRQALAVDLLYHPAESPWLAALRARGVRAANGLGLLVEQALYAQAFWFGDEPPRSALEEALTWSDPFSRQPAGAPGWPGAGSSASRGEA